MVPLIKAYLPVINNTPDCHECCMQGLENCIFSQIYPILFNLYTRKVLNQNPPITIMLLIRYIHYNTNN